MNFIHDSPDRLFPQDENPGGPPAPPQAQGKKFIALLLVALIGLSAMAIGGAWFLYRMYRTLPTLDQLENIDPPLSSKVMGKDGTLVYEFSIEKRSWMSLNKIPAALVNAVLAIEDRKFYDHWGRRRQTDHGGHARQSRAQTLRPGRFDPDPAIGA